MEPQLLLLFLLPVAAFNGYVFGLHRGRSQKRELIDGLLATCTESHAATAERRDAHARLYEAFGARDEARGHHIAALQRTVRVLAGRLVNDPDIGPLARELAEEEG